MMTVEPSASARPPPSTSCGSVVVVCRAPSRPTLASQRETSTPKRPEVAIHQPSLKRRLEGPVSSLDLRRRRRICFRKSQPHEGQRLSPRLINPQDGQVKESKVDSQRFI